MGNIRSAHSFYGCPNAVAVMPLSGTRPLRWFYWDIPVHGWLLPHRKECIKTVIHLEYRLDELGTLPSLPHDIWLYVLGFVRRCDFAPPQKFDDLPPVYTNYLKSIYARIVKVCAHSLQCAAWML